MRKYMLLAMTIFSHFAIAQSGFEISGSVSNSNAPLDKIFLSYAMDGAMRTDSTVIQDGKYAFKGTLKEPLLASLRVKYKEAADAKSTKAFSVRRDAFQLFIENAKIKVASKDSFSNAVVAGSRSDKDYRVLLKGLKPLNDQMSQLSTAYMEARTKKDEETMKRLDAKADTLQDEIRLAYKSFLSANTGSPIAMYAFRNFAGWDINPAEVEPVFLRLSETARNSQSGLEMAARIQKAKQVGIGSIAPNFTQNDTLGNPVALFSFRGKYLLIDFWASWCGPCRQENPNVVAAWQKYKDKGFDVLGVSLDQPTGKERWMKAIHDDKLTWTQVSDLKYWKNEVAVSYGIQAIPQNYLLDPNGVIIGKNLRGEALQSKLAELFR